MIDKNLLRQAREALRKEAYVPMTPEAQAAAQQPPPPPGGDPAAAGGAPMDPAAMAGGAMPMDPNAMAQGDPSVMPPGGDPNAAPPMDPNAMPPPPPPPPPPSSDPTAGGQPIMLNLKDLQELFKQINDDGNDTTDAAQDAGAPESSSKRVTNKMLNDKIEEINQTLSMVVQTLGIQPPTQQVGLNAGQSAASASPADIQAVLSQMPPGAAPAPMPKGAAVRSKDKLTKMIERLRAK